jgi:hypothetical protein
VDLSEVLGSRDEVALSWVSRQRKLDEARIVDFPKSWTKKIWFVDLPRT